MAIENTFIYLMGFAGTGKLTIAKELQKIVPSILVDNHLILNVVFSLIEPEFKAMDPVGARARIENYELLRPPGYNHFDLNVTALTATESAQQIACELRTRYASSQLQSLYKNE